LKNSLAATVRGIAEELNEVIRLPDTSIISEGKKWLKMSGRAP